MLAWRAAVAFGALAVSSTGFTATIHTTQVPLGGSGPSGTNACDGGGSGPGGCTPYELGMQFQSAVDGYITAIRFWRADSEPFADNQHVGRIWAADGTLLDSVSFTGETAGAGWQEQALATPLSILASTTYTVSVNSLGYYVYSSQGLRNGINNGFLTALAGLSLGQCSGSGNANGVYASAGTFPTSSYNCNDYFRDVQFSIAEWVVPVPAAFWLLSSAFGALGWLRRKPATI